MHLGRLGTEVACEDAATNDVMGAAAARNRAEDPTCTSEWWGTRRGAADYLGRRAFNGETGGVTKPLASGLRALQSSGGKAMRQKRGEGSRNSMPTSDLPAWDSPISTTSP